jgi:hypothetical protein
MAFRKQTVIARPLARSERLLVEAVGDETVIYELDTNVAHALKPLAAAVFNYADGKNTAAEIAELSSYRLATTVTEAEVADAISQLDALSLLDTPELSLIESGMSRRDALKVFGAVGAGTVLVSSVAAPFASANTLSNYGEPYVCAKQNGSNLEDITDASSYNNVSNSQAPSGWPQPYKVSGSGYAFVTGTNPGAPVSGSVSTLGQSCYAATSPSTVYGTYQVVPCDGNAYQCAQVVCVPTTNGKSNGTPTSIAGAITSGSILPATDDYPTNVGKGNGYGPYYDAEYSGWPFKFCCVGNDCTS